MSDPSTPGLARRWDRFVLRTQGRLDGEGADRLIPAVGAVVVFGIYLSLAALRLGSDEGGSGLAPWVQAAWRRAHGGAGAPVGGLDPARSTWSLVSEPVLWVTRFAPPEAVFAVVQATAIALAVIPLWRLARDEAHLRVGASAVVIVGYALAPTLHRANLTPFHPELIALPALVWAWLHARRQHWIRFGICVALILACRADLGLTVVALGLVVASHGARRPGLIAAASGLAWTVIALVVIDPSLPDSALTPAGEFLNRSVGPLAVAPQLLAHPLREAGEMVAEPSVLFLVVILAPLLFLPLLSARTLLVAAPCVVLAMLADRTVQQVAQSDVLSLSPAAAHIGPAMGFVFIALVYSLERVGHLSVTRVNVDRRLLVALLAGVILFFVTEAPSTPYRKPWAWGTLDSTGDARRAAVDRVDDDASVAASPTLLALVAGRANLTALPSSPDDLTDQVLADATATSDVVLVDFSAVDPVLGEPEWSADDRDRVLGWLDDLGYVVESDTDSILILHRQ